MISYSNKIFITVAILLILLSGVLPNTFGRGYFSTKEVKAFIFVPVLDKPANVQLGEQTGLSVWQKIQKYWELYIRPALRDAAAKRLMDYITQQTLDWINNGKTPTFVGNWGQFSKQAGNIAFDSVNNYLVMNGQGNLCGPFLPQLQIQAYVMNPNQAYLYGGELPVSCSFKDFQQNLSNQTHFLESGGWLAYDALFDPMNNPDWLSIRLEDYYNRVYAKNVTEKTNEAISASGYLSQKQCVQYDQYIDAQGIQDTCKNDQNPDACVSSLTQEHCTNWNITTPGDVAAKAVANAITSDSYWAANIQNFVSVVINALINKVFQKGLSALSSSDVNYSNDVTTGSDPTATANFNSVKTEWENTYSNILYYYNSADYPTLQIWQDSLSLAQQGRSNCVPSDEWQTTYNNASLVVDGISSMVTVADSNKQKIDQVDPTLMSATELSQQIATFNAEYSSFTSQYSSFISDSGVAKQNGDMTETEKTGISQKSALTTAYTPPSCGSPNATSTAP